MALKLAVMQWRQLSFFFYFSALGKIWIAIRRTVYVQQVWTLVAGETVRGDEQFAWVLTNCIR